MRIAATLIITLFTLAYPLIVYFGVQRVSPLVFAAVFGLLACLRYAVAKQKGQFADLAPFVVVIIYSIALSLSEGDALLRLYPVVVSLSMAVVFALSLRAEKSFIESLASLSGKAITPNAKRYTRRLTAVWASLLLVNALVALYLAMYASLENWALYCGLLAYIIMGIVFAAEWLFRQYYIRRWGE